MTKEQLFESMQYIGDDLLAESEKPARVRRPWIGVAAAAACVVIIAGVWFGREQPKAAAGDIETMKGNQTAPPDAIPVGVPVGVNGPASLPDAAPTVLAWKELESMPESEEMFFALFGQLLTDEQLAMCGPEIRLEWMESLRGWAEFFGWGELYRVNLTATDPAWGGEIRIRIRDLDAPEAPALPVDADWREKTDPIPSLNGKEYRAYRLEHDYLPGEPHVWMCAVFEQENVEYTFLADVPAEQETEAAVDLMDLLLAYMGTHRTPDLASIHWEGPMTSPPGTPDE